MAGMSPLSTRQIRQAYAARVLSAAPGLTESRWGYIGMTDPTRSPVHMSFGIGVPTTDFLSLSQKTSPVVEVETDVRVLIQYQLADHEQVKSMDDALDLLQIVRNHLLVIDPTWPVGVKPVWRRDENTSIAPGWIQVESTYSVRHYDPLS